jgi:multidrug efflux pump subunit AcrA (membrane-fusion protein)
MNRRKAFISLIIVLAVASASWYFYQKKNKADTSDPIITNVLSGPFKISVSATGELKAKNSVKIVGPQGMRAAGIWQTKIETMKPEGTLVKAGETIATLDKSSIQSKIDEVNAEIEQVETQLEQARIDTAIDLSTMRDRLADLQFTMKEKKLTVEQNQFEPEMIVKQAQLDLIRAERDHKQLKENYRLKQQQAKAKISEKNAILKQQKNKMNLYVSLSSEFDIKAPKDGMLIYISEWNGEKTTVGSSISGWNPNVAELPDLTQMNSKIYVNEVDISKVKKGQEVEVSIDAFPDKLFQGNVVSIANIGQQLRNQDAKVFEVIVELDGTDPALRPAMTTGNTIITREYDDQAYIPLETLHQDSLSYVFVNRKGKDYRQEVLTGPSNENNIIVHLGLEPGEKIYLHYDADEEKATFVPLDEHELSKMKKQITANDKAYEQEMARLAAMVTAEAKPTDWKAKMKSSPKK